MAFNPQTFEHVYGFDIFDTIHNFFPEIIYDDTLFMSDMQNWMRHRMTVYFPAMYSRQQNLYRIYRSNPIREEYRNWRLGNLSNEVYHSTPVQPIPLQPSRTQVPVTYIPTRGSTIHRSQPIRVPQTNEPILHRSRRVVRTNPNPELLISILSSSIFSDMEEMPRTWNRWGEDVEVFPTADHISAASEITSHSTMPNETVCAICQDHESQIPQENWRNLHCHHAFHLSCIDNWFRRNVHCPVCRKDIREFSAGEDEN